MRDTILWKSFEDPNGGWGGTAFFLLVISVVVFLYWAAGKRPQK